MICLLPAAWFNLLIQFSTLTTYPISNTFSAAFLWQVAIVGLWLGLVGSIAVAAHRFAQADHETLRKIVHIGSGNFILLAWWLKIPLWLGVSAAIACSLLALLSYVTPILSSINGVGRRSFGTFFYAVSIGVLVAWFWSLGLPQFAAIGILTMAWGDGLAALIGKRWGRHAYQLWDMKKSWEGSGTMAVVSYGVSAMVLITTQGNLWQVWLIALITALCATGLEAFSKFGIDNLTVPIGSAALGFLLSQILIG